MTASKPNTLTDWSKVDADDNTPADYEELPELDDVFFDRAERAETIVDRPVSLSTNLEEAGRVARLREAIIEIWGRVEVKRGLDGGLLLSFQPVSAEDGRSGVDDD